MDFIAYSGIILDVWKFWWHNFNSGAAISFTLNKPIHLKQHYKYSIGHGFELRGSGVQTKAFWFWAEIKDLDLADWWKARSVGLRSEWRGWPVRPHSDSVEWNGAKLHQLSIISCDLWAAILKPLALPHHWTAPKETETYCVCIC